MELIAAILAVIEVTLLQILAELRGKPLRLPSLFPKIAKQKYSLVTLQNMGDTKPVPMVAPELEIRFARELLNLYTPGKRYKLTDIKLTEATWVTTGVWKKIGGGSPQNFRDLLDRWGVEGIVIRDNPAAKNSKWILSRDWVGRLRAKVLNGKNNN